MAPCSIGKRRNAFVCVTRHHAGASWSISFHSYFLRRAINSSDSFRYSSTILTLPGSFPLVVYLSIPQTLPYLFRGSRRAACEKSVLQIPIFIETLVSPERMSFNTVNEVLIQVIRQTRVLFSRQSFCAVQA